MFFDWLNVTTTYQGVKSKKAALYPYKEPDDWRFKVIQQNLGFEFWFVAQLRVEFSVLFICHFKSGEDMLDRVGIKG